MSLKGDASYIPLANIFQTLQMNGQDGVLTVNEGKFRRKLRILPAGIRLLAQGRDNPDVLRLALVKQKIVTDSQFQNIISTMGATSTFPGDFLIARRILTRAQVEKDVIRQFLELVHEVFSWKKAKYEFVANDPGDGLEIFDPEDLGEILIFNTPGLLMEIARREDDWGRIRAEIPSEREIYVPLEKSSFQKPRTYSTDVEAATIAEVKKGIDGEHTLEAIAADSTFSSFDVHRAVFLLRSEKEIRPLTLKEKKDLAEDLRKKLKTREVVEIYRHLLEADPDDTETRMKLVTMLEKKKENAGPLLVEQYSFLADSFFDAGEHVQAQTYLEKTLEIDAGSIDALEKLFDLHHFAGNAEEAIDAVHKTLDSAKAKKDYDRGIGFLRKAIDAYPGEAFLYHDLADLYVLGGRGEESVPILKSVATIYEDRGDLTKLRKTYERIVSIDPSEGPTLKRIAEAERRQSRSRSIRPPSRKVLWMSLAAGAVLGIAYLISLEAFARRAHALVKGDVETCIRSGDFLRARQILEDVARRYPISTIRGRISSEARLLSVRQKEHDEERRKEDERQKVQIGSFLARVETLLIGKRYIEALALVEEMSRNPLSPGNRKQVTAVQAEVRQYFGAAADLVQRGRELIAAGRHEEAHREYLKLLLNYANTPAARGLKLPLLVRSMPSGAIIKLNEEVVGTTPLTVFYDPLAKFGLSVTKEGFRPVGFGDPGVGPSIDFTKDWAVTARLERIPAWVFDAKAPVECTPLILGDRILFGTRGGRIYCLDRATGTERWSYDIPDGWDVASAIRAHGDRIAFGTFQGAFHILDARTGAPLHRLVPLSPPRPIRHPASEATAEGILAVNCGGIALAGVNTVTGALAWTLRVENEILGSPELHGGSIIFIAVDGTIHTVDPERGTVTARFPLGFRVEAPGRASGGCYTFSDKGGRIRRIHLRTGHILWTYESPMENLTPPAIGSGIVFVGSGDGLLAALDETTGDLRWKGKVNEGLAAPAVWSGGNFYLGTKAGQAIALEGTGGAPAWTFAAGGAFAASPGAGGGSVLFGCDDHRVYAFAEK